MLDTPTKRRIDTCRDILVGKVPDPKSQVEQITIALIYKFMDDMDLEAEELGGERRFFTKDYERYRWAKLVAPGVSGQDMLNTYSEALTKMVENEGLPKLFRDIFRNAYLPYRDPETLRAFLREIDTFTYDHSERLGDAFEYLLSVLGSQGDAGQFRTPRHIIDFMVEIIDPKKNEVILDPACGTAGFLISAYKHILKQNSTGVANGNGTSTEGDAAEQALESPMRYPGDLLQPDDRTRLARSIKGYDISPDMVRLSLVNLYLHGFADPKIEEYDTLTSEDKWTEMADVILANPPFMSPKGGIKPHTRFRVQSKRSEVLFVDYIAEHLTPNGRAAIVVPEGIIFQSQSAYVALRKMLVENHLAAVISLPAGVFNPYSGVKTSVLILDRAVAKASKHVAFFKIENDGFALGAQRKAVKGSQLAQVKAELGAWLQAARAGGGERLESNLGSAVERARLAEGGDYNLSAERYSLAEQRLSSFPIVSLGDIASIRMGETLIKGDLTGHGRPIFSADSSDKPWAYTENTKLSFGRNTLVIGARGTIGSIKHPNIDDFTATQTTIVVTADEAQISTEYLFRFLRAFDFGEITEGVGIPMITVKNVSAIKLPLPPLDVQREIVAEVEGYQRVIDGARAVLDNYLPHIPVDPEWPIVELGDVCDLYQPKTITSSDLKADGEFVVYGANGIIGRYHQFNHEHPEVLITCRGATCGTINMSQPRSWVTGNAMVATPKDGRIDKSFLHSLLLGSDLSSTISGSAQPQITRQGLSPFKIPLPPIEVQQAIAAEIEAEQVLVNGNRDLIARFEIKIDAAIARVWGEAKAEGVA